MLIESGYIDKPLHQVMTEGGWNTAMIDAAGDWKVSWEDTRNRGDWRAYSRLRVHWGGIRLPRLRREPTL